MFGSDKLKNLLLPQVCQGDLVVGIAMSEPDAGLNIKKKKIKRNRTFIYLFIFFFCKQARH